MSQSSKLRVYLGGYMAVDDRVDWRMVFRSLLDKHYFELGFDELDEEVTMSNVTEHFEVLEPRAGIDHYAMRDLRLLRQADVMVAYVTPWVNKGIGVSWEMGWCFAQGIPVIMVLEPGHDYASWGLNEQFASTVVSSLDEAANVLSQMR